MRWMYTKHTIWETHTITRVENHFIKNTRKEYGRIINIKETYRFEGVGGLHNRTKGEDAGLDLSRCRHSPSAVCLISLRWKSGV